MDQGLDKYKPEVFQPGSISGKPIIEDFHKANVAVLADKLPKKIEAIFFHGSCIDDVRITEIVIDHASELYHLGSVDYLVINGIGNIGGYHGASAWRRSLVDRGVPDASILEFAPSDKTALESASILDFAGDRGWKEIVISALSHHQLRCFLQLVAEMQRRGDWSQVVYNRPTRGIPWDWIFTKPSINPKVAPVTGNLEVHSELEVRNVLRYAVPAEDRENITNFTPHATIEEMFQYLRWRDERLTATR